MNRRNRTIVVIVLVVAVAIIGFVFAKPSANALPVRETVVHYGDFVTKLPETGVVQLPRTVTIPAGVSGNFVTKSP